MIPKIIHYCWLSNDPYPEKIQECIDSWRKYLPDYEIRLWNLERFPLDKSRWVKQAFENRKYAFAADYIRAYALYTEGGIYLDSDVEVLTSLDFLLKHKYFIGHEHGHGGNIEAAVVGAEQGHPLYGELLKYYDTHEFVLPDGSFSTTPMPQIVASILEKNFTVREINTPDEISDTDEICVLPWDYFSPKSYADGKIYRTENSVTIHHFSGSWVSPWEKRKHRWSAKYPRFMAVMVAIKHALKGIKG